MPALPQRVVRRSSGQFQHIKSVLQGEMHISLFKQLTHLSQCLFSFNKLHRTILNLVSPSLRFSRPLAEIIQQVSIQSCTGQQSDCSVTQTAALDCGIAQLRSGKSSTAD